jgi:hypothetical protein
MVGGVGGEQIWCMGVVARGFIMRGPWVSTLGGQGFRGERRDGVIAGGGSIVVDVRVGVAA